MRILWFNWRCIKHPLAGGAEVYTHEIAKRLVADGHDVILVTSRPKYLVQEEMIDGYRVIRTGGKYTVYLKARKVYKALKKEGWTPDILIDEINTIPFFTVYYADEPIVTLIHQLCKECWDYMYKAPINWLGWLIEKEIHKIYSSMARSEKIAYIITVSPSTKNDLIRLGYPDDRISIIYNGVNVNEVSSCDKLFSEKEDILLYFGRIIPYKRIEDILLAWEIVRKTMFSAKLIIAGRADSRYLKELKIMLKSKGIEDVEFLIDLSESEKRDLFRRAKINIITSVREGWGRTIIEAGLYCIPTVAYNVPGVKDSIIDGRTGILAKNNNPFSLAKEIIRILKDPSLWKYLSVNSRIHSEKYSWENSYRAFINLLMRCKN